MRAQGTNALYMYIQTQAYKHVGIQIAIFAKRLPSDWAAHALWLLFTKTKLAIETENQQSPWQNSSFFFSLHDESITLGSSEHQYSSY